MNDLPPTTPERARPRWWLRGLLLLALASTAWLGWREFDHRAAIRATINDLSLYLVPMVEAMAALVLADHALRQRGQCGV